MKKYVLFSGLFILQFAMLNAQKTTVQEVTKICEGLPKSEKPIVVVMPFKIAANGANSAAGTGMADVLTNAISNTGCFRVMEREQLEAILKEQGLGLSGAVDESTAPQLGKLSGAQVLVFGTLTKFDENASGGGGGLGKFGRGILGKIGGAAANGKTTTSKLGYTLRFVDATTGEVLDSKLFDKSTTSFGLAGSGGGWNGSSVTAGGGSFYQNKSMQDAIEQSFGEAVAYMAQNKAAYTELLNNAKANETSKLPNSSTTDCPLLKIKTKPSIVVILPEEHVTGEGSAYDPYRHRVDITINTSHNNGMGEYISTAPCQAGESEIASKLSEAGFRLKDASQLDELKKESEFQDAYNNPDDASKIASRYNVDMVIVGDAFSEYSKKANGLVSCRATVSVKAVMRNDASIIAYKSFDGAGLDATELIAGKAALRTACTKLANYLQTQFCTKGDDIIASMNAPQEPRNNTPKTLLKKTELVKSDEGSRQSEISFSGRMSRETTLSLSGLSYEQYKSLSGTIERMKGVSLVKKQGYTMMATAMQLTTVLTTDELIDNIEKWNPKLHYMVSAATDEAIMLTITDEK